MKFNTDLQIGEYTQLVDRIVAAYFDDNGDYVPHMGRVITMMYFFDVCVLDSPFVIEDRNNIMEYQEVFDDEEFCKAYNSELRNSARSNRLSFNQAYHDAMDIVAVKNNSVNKIMSGLEKMVNVLSSTMTTDSLKELSDVADKLSVLDTYIKDVENTVPDLKD